MLGKYIGCDPIWEMKTNYRWAWVQIEVDLKDGLVDKIELVWGGFAWMSKVDYWRVLFFFYGCLKFGHLQGKCRHSLALFPSFQKT
jgi:hypothetical protein